MQTYIREVRLQQGWKQKDLAQRIGKTATTLSKYEQGQMEISVTVLCRIAQALGVPVARLLVASSSGRCKRREPAA